MRFQDKVVVVTGAAQGIGEAYARALAGEGAAVVVADLNEEAGRQVAKRIEVDGRRALFVRCDVSSAESAEALVRTVVEEYGGIDHLVNNAAIYGAMEFNLLITVDWDYYKRFMGVNMDGALVMTRAVFAHMQARGGGSIVNQSSTAAWLYSGFYGLAKAGIKLLAHGAVTDDDYLNSAGDETLGTITSDYYSAAHPSAMNKKFVADFEKLSKGKRPNFFGVAGYDGMHVIYNAIKTTKDIKSGDALLAAMKGQSFESPRGPVTLDPKTRDFIQNIYVRQVERVDGQLYNVEFDTIKNVLNTGNTE